MSVLRPAFLWALIVVAAAAGGVYLTDQLFIAPSRAMQRQLAERDAQIKVLTEQNQALEAAIRLLRYTERRARLVVLDALVVKFEDTSVMGGDALKGKALLLFRRIFTDRRRPAEGEVLDREGQMPQSYAAERAPTAFERELWARFWELANDPEEAKKRGVRALHGEAVSTRLRKDRIYTITLRSTGS